LYAHIAALGNISLQITGARDASHPTTGLADRTALLQWKAMVRVLSALAALSFTAAACLAAPCPGNPQALGTERVLQVDVKSTPRVGRKQFPTTLPLRAKELVLTFDDGPWPGTTPKVLDTLKAECVQATFFLLGRNVEAHPQLARRALAEGHSLGHHSYSHPLLNHLTLAKAEAEIERGIRADETAVYGKSLPDGTVRLFRFPGFAASAPLLELASRHGLAVFGADVWASDWVAMSPQQELRLVLSRIERVGRGIVLFHDTKIETARMLPMLLRELKRRGYTIVHVIPAARS